MKKEDFPEKWILKVDQENVDIVNKWRDECFGYNNIDIDFYVNEAGQGVEWLSERGGWGRGEITIEDFIEFVLKKEQITIKEDYSYLMHFLKTLNIK